MFKGSTILTALLCCCYLFSFSQNMNSNWVFGDSAGINFSNLSNPVTFGSGMDGRGSCVSMSDSAGNLLFYVANITSYWGGNVYNSNHQIMQNGDSIVCLGWYHEFVTIPYPGNSSMYYLFSIEGTSTLLKGLWYSVIDMSLNGGL